jgi:hypothetical protein
LEDDDRVDPRTAPTWWDDRLPLTTYETDQGRSKVRLWWRRMLDIRRGDLSRLASGDITITHLNDANGVAAFIRDAGKYLVVLNFRGGSWAHYDVGVRGRYQELANTSWPVFNLGNYPERTRGGDRAYDIVNVAIPAYGAGESHMTCRALRRIRIGIERKSPRFENCVIAASLIRKRLLTSSAAPYAIALAYGAVVFVRWD